jgi:hypothetical protein
VTSVDRDIRRATSRIAAAQRWGTAERADEYRRLLRYLVLRRAIVETMATDPPLTEAQRERLAALLAESVHAGQSAGEDGGKE